MADETELRSTQLDQEIETIRMHDLLNEANQLIQEYGTLWERLVELRTQRRRLIGQIAC